MVAFSTNSTKHYNVRSISLPARSHPTTVKVEEALDKLTSWEMHSSSSKAEKIRAGLSGLGELYRSIGELFSLPLTQQALSQHQNEKWVNELLDGFLRYLDICGNTREAILLMKESVRELQSALRRSKCGEMSFESNVTAYICSRKTMKKEIAKSLASLKYGKNIMAASPDLDNLNDHLYLVIRILRKVSLITTSILNSLLSFLSVPMLKPKPTRWSLVLKLVHKRVATYESQWEVNELESVDIAITNLLVQQSSKDVEAEKIESAHERLQALDASIEGFEHGLEGLFRRLIHAKVTLLNIFSQ
ncbi:uncharacterized protein LOC123195778 [Mangifera indica]|uniref:uncharacterized protein LOC123195778 n=1 Tax=Mangifera indica TaxID=29780 RepID=UPI001CFA9B53|nr:uncharacterized protein LOC123195778 [Mangifera indica]